MWRLSFFFFANKWSETERLMGKLRVKLASSQTMIYRTCHQITVNSGGQHLRPPHPTSTQMNKLKLFLLRLSMNN